jgi:xanthosine phosphorylase
MSLVGEIIAARHCGLKCAALSIVVNLASGLTTEHITHKETLHYSKQASSDVSKLVLKFVESINKIK